MTLVRNVFISVSVIAYSSLRHVSPPQWKNVRGSIERDSKTAVICTKHNSSRIMRHTYRLTKIRQSALLLLQNRRNTHGNNHDPSVCPNGAPQILYKIAGQVKRAKQRQRRWTTCRFSGRVRSAFTRSRIVSKTRERSKVHLARYTYASL